MKIESTKNQTIKALSLLHQKKERDRTGTFLVEGLHMIQEAASAGILRTIYQLDSLAPTGLAPTVECTQPVLNKLSVLKSDARYIGLCGRPVFSDMKSSRKILVLDHLQDPGNVGTLIRTAYAFGIELVVLSAGCADPFGPKTLQSSQGAAFHIPVVSENLIEILPKFKQQEITVLGAALHQDSVCLHDLQIPDSYALIIGNEGQGIRPEILDLCDQTIFIEMKQFESLNAAIAGSILMYVFQFPGQAH